MTSVFCLSLLLSAAPPAACGSGELLFAPSYLPVDIALSPDGSELVVADLGFLSIRDPATLKVRRYLAPGLNGWDRARFSADGKRVHAETLDGLRVDIELSTGALVRDFNRPGSSVRALKEYESFRPQQALPHLAEEAGERFRALAQELELGDPLGGEQAVAVAFTGDLKEFVAASAGGRLIHVDVRAKKVLSRGETGEQILHLEIAPNEVLALTESEQLLALNRALQVVQRAQLAPDVFGRRRPTRAVPSAPPSRRQPLALARGAGRNELIWLADDHTLGSIDLRSGKLLALLEPTGSNGVSGGVLDEGRLALGSNEALRVWEIATQKLLVDWPQGVTGVMRGGRGQLAVVGMDGSGVLLDPLSPGSAARSGKCLMPEWWCGFDPLAGKFFDPRYGSLEMVPSPDHRQFLLIVKQQTSIFQPDSPVSFVLRSFEARTLKPLGMATMKMEVSDLRRLDPNPSFETTGQLRLLGTSFSFPGLKSLGEKPSTPPDASPRCFGGGRVCLKAVVSDGLSEDELSIRGPTGDHLGFIARTESSDHSRAQYRRASRVDPTTDGSRFLLMSLSTQGLFAAGAAQVWCTPRDALSPLPAEPDRNAHSMLKLEEGLTEVPLPNAPQTYLSMDALDGGAVVLAMGPYRGADAGDESRSLWHLDARGQMRPLSLPIGSEPWERVAAGEHSLWVASGKSLGAQFADGGWVTMPLGVEHMSVFHTVPGDGLVVAGWGRCAALAPDGGISDAELRKLYRDTAFAFQVPQTVIVQAFEVELTPEIAAMWRASPSGARQEKDRARELAALESLKTEIKAPNSDLLALSTRAQSELNLRVVKTEPKLEIKLGPWPSLGSSLERAVENALVGEVLGPISTRSENSPGDRRTFLKVVARSPASVQSFEARKTELRTWANYRLSGNQCIKLVVFDHSGGALRRELRSDPRVDMPMLWLDDGFIVLGMNKVRYQAGRFLDDDPLLELLSRFEVLAASARGGTLFLRNGNYLQSVDIKTRAILAVSPSFMERYSLPALAFVGGAEGRVEVWGNRDSKHLQLIHYSDQLGRFESSNAELPAWAAGAHTERGIDVVERDGVVWVRRGAQILSRSDGADSSIYFHPTTRDRELVLKRGAH